MLFMDIGIDLRVLAGGAYGGIAQYLLGLLPELFKLDQRIKFKLFFSSGNNKIRPWIFKKVEPWLDGGNVRLFQFNYPNRLLFASSRLLNYPKLDYLVRGADVFFSPHFFSAPLSARCRSVVTFHDLSFIRHPEFFSWRKNIWHRLEMNPRVQAQRADKIIAVSNSTKNDLINLFGVGSEKIEVIYSGVGKSAIRPTFDPRLSLSGEVSGGRCFSPPIESPREFSGRCMADLPIIKKKYNLPEKFFLFLGALEPRKNILGILKAFTYLKSTSQIPDESALVIAGPLGWLYADIFKFRQASPYKNFIHFIGPVEEEDKSAIYSLAQVFVYPSFFEGFGFPPLEAMEAGVPVVTSRTSSLPEVAGKAGILVDPYNFKEIAEAMKNLFTDENLRNFYIEKGKERARLFSWKRSAEKTLEVLTAVD